jgi:hypothetical protein
MTVGSPHFVESLSASFYFRCRAGAKADIHRAGRANTANSNW